MKEKIQQVELANKIINAVKNKIELADGRVREIDAIDYYLLSDEEFASFVENVEEELSVQDKKILQKYGYSLLGRHKNQRRFEPVFEKPMDKFKVEEIYNQKYIVGVKFDEFGKYIEGSGRVISEEEKTEAFDYIKKLNCPFSEKMFKAVITRIVNDIPLDNSIENNVERSRQ